MADIILCIKIQKRARLVAIFLDHICFIYSIYMHHPKHGKSMEGKPFILSN